MLMPYLIDGYNLLWRIHNGGESVSDIQLCRAIDRYLDIQRQRGTMVFDGIGPPDKSDFFSLDSLSVQFVGEHTDADSVIEYQIEQSTAPKLLNVVSSDRRVRDAAKRRKAGVILSEQFWSMVKVALSKGSRRESPPGGKIMGISDAETERWMKEFGLDE